MTQQLDLFDFDDSIAKFPTDKKVRLITLFSGYDAQALALKYAGIPFEHYKTCEWAINSISALKDIHFTDDNTDYSKDLTREELVQYLLSKGISNNYSTSLTEREIRRYSEEKLRKIYNDIQAEHNLVDIKQVHGKDLEIVDTDKYSYCMFYSWPCFTGDSLVLTRNGYKPIKDIQIGDYVLTHTNTYQKVLNVFDNGVHHISKLQTSGADEIKLTPNHKLYVREMYRAWNTNSKREERKFKDPEWKELKDLDKSYYVGTPINQNSIIPDWDGIDIEWKDGRKARHRDILVSLMDNPSWWYVVGRYFADGWLRKQGGITICSNPNKLKPLTDTLDSMNIHYYVAKERTTIKVHITQREVGAFFEPFGGTALTKHLTNTILDLPRDLLESFLGGYWYADGCIGGKWYRATTISRELAYGLGECITKVYHRPYSISKCIRPEITTIEGRVVHQHSTFEVKYKLETNKQDKAFYENGYVWCPIRKIDDLDDEEVYDIEVENDHSFTIQNVIVHNCQDLSLAGKRQGMTKESGTRSSMLWEVERILNECETKPQVLIAENVDAVLSQTYKKDFLEWVHTLDLMGYHSYYQILNAKDYGLPQSRKRLFMVSLLGDYYYAFPNPYPLKYRLKDLLEDEVDDKYYVSDRALHGALTTNFQSGRLENRLPDKDGVVGTLCARDWKDPKLVEVSGNISQSEKVYDPNGISSCLCAGGGGLGGKTGLYRVHKRGKFTRVCEKGEIKEIERDIDESGLVEFGSYLTWPNKKGNINTQSNRVNREGGVALTLDTLNGSAKVLLKQESLKKELCNYLIEENKVQEGDVISHSYTKNRINIYTSAESRIENTNNHNCSPALTTRADTLGVVIQDNKLNEHPNEEELESKEYTYSIRKLTPRECFRLMGVKDEDFDKIKGLRDAALYHLAGDSICTTVLIAIFNKLFKGENTKYGN